MAEQDTNKDKNKDKKKDKKKEPEVDSQEEVNQFEHLAKAMADQLETTPPKWAGFSTGLILLSFAVLSALGTIVAVVNSKAARSLFVRAFDGLKGLHPKFGQAATWIDNNWQKPIGPTKSVALTLERVARIAGAMIMLAGFALLLLPYPYGYHAALLVGIAVPMLLLFVASRNGIDVDDRITAWYCLIVSPLYMAAILSLKMGDANGVASIPLLSLGLVAWLLAWAVQRFFNLFDDPDAEGGVSSEIGDYRPKNIATVAGRHSYQYGGPGSAFLHKSSGRRQRLGVRLSRPFNAFAHIVIFSVAAILLMPPSMRDGTMVVGVIAVALLFSSLNLLKGVQSNRLYYAMTIVALVMYSSAAVKTLSPAIAARVDSALVQAAAPVARYLDKGKLDKGFEQYTITQLTKPLQADGTVASSITFTGGQKVMASPEVYINPGDLGMLYYGVYHLDADGKRTLVYYPEAYLEKVRKKKPSKKRNEDNASALAKSGSSHSTTRNTRVASGSESFPLVVKIEKENVWQDVPYIPLVRDLVEWGPFPEEADLLRISYRVGKFGDVKSPGVNRRSGGVLGLSATHTNNSSANFQVKVTSGGPVAIPINIRRGAYRGPLKGTV